jgi:hypothetical protein
VLIIIEDLVEKRDLGSGLMREQLNSPLLRVNRLIRL